MIEEGSKGGREVARKRAKFAGFFIHVAQVFVEGRYFVNVMRRWMPRCSKG